MKLNKKGFTLIELMGVIVVILLMSVMAINTYNKSLIKNEKKVFISEAVTISEGALNKFADDRLNNDYGDDLYLGKVSGKYCYSIEHTLKNYFIRKFDTKYTGSVEVCPECDVRTKVWLTNGEYYINGADPDNVQRNDLTKTPTGENYNFCGRTSISTNEVYAYDYLGREQIFVALKAGVYKIEAWGAAGGAYESKLGGYGGYAVGQVRLKQGQELYINVGGKGNDAKSTQGHNSYNGGGTGFYNSTGATGDYTNFTSGGGGASSVALKPGLLSKLYNKKEYVIIVAGGGGGAGLRSDDTPGSGGGFTGGVDYYGAAPNQVDGYAFGKGQDTTRACWMNTAGAGGGWYGGRFTSLCESPSGAGGSGYINYKGLTNSHMYGYNVETSDVAGITTLSGTATSETPTADKAKIGDGYIKITYLGA